MRCESEAPNSGCVWDNKDKRSWNFKNFRSEHAEIPGR